MLQARMEMFSGSRERVSITSKMPQRSAALDLLVLKTKLRK